MFVNNKQQQIASGTFLSNTSSLLKLSNGSTHIGTRIMAVRGLLVVHEWPVLIGHEGVARVVYQN